ncbi:hypothetical protein OA264_03400 [Alphaproteobacteria bacterium]|nr:hypothetical protein [Alphaproteobacteria bacterium]
MSCSYQKIQKKDVIQKKYDPIILNIYEYRLILDKKNVIIPNFLGFDGSFLVTNLTEWGNKKIKVNGFENSLSMIIKNFSLEKKDIKKYKGIKKLFLSEEKVEYNLKIKISLNFLQEDRTSKILNLSGNISFFIDDSHSINKKKDFLLSSYYELIRKVDKTLENEISKETFSKFRISL